VEQITLDRPDTSSENSLSFRYLPGYAEFILHNHLYEYVKTQLSIARAQDLPILKFFSSLTEEQIITFSEQSSGEFLSHLANNKAWEYIHFSVQRWKNDQLPIVGKLQITAEDITLISYTRRKALINLLPLYTLDFLQALSIINELEDYFKEADTSASNTYSEILRQTIREREDQLLEAQEIAGLGSFTWNLTTLEGDVTPQVNRILELNKGEGFKAFLNNVPAEDRKKFHTALKHAKEMSGVFDCEYRYFSSKGERVLWSRGNIYNVKGDQVLRGTVMDITEKHQMLYKLQESDKLYKQAQERAHIGNFVWDLATNNIIWSDELYKIYGIDPSTAVTFKGFAEMLTPEGREQLLDQINKAVTTGKPADFDFKIKVADGKRKTLNIKAEVVLDKKNNPVKIIGTTQDVTEVNKLVDKLRKSESQLKQAQAISHMGSWELELATKKMKWSDELYRIYEMEPRESLSFDEVVSFRHPDDREEMNKEFDLAVKSGKPIDIVFRIILPGGEIKFLNSRGEVKKDARGKIVKLIGTTQDITKQIDTENILQEKNRQLQLSNASLEEFAYIASHDMKEPLRKISTFGEMLLSFTKDSLSEQGKLYVKKMIDGGKRMQKMIDDLLALSVIAHDNAFQVTDLNSTLHKVLLDLELKVNEKKAVIDHDHLPTLSVVPSQFEQLFLNLLNNSLKFSTPERSPVIHIATRHLDSHELSELGLPSGAQYVSISFRDNGIGFEKQYADKIFGMFQRLNGKVDYEGSGIGLAICKKIAEHHGGIITAKGALNEGAEFNLIIPVQ
jgi:PAS domain S-box-containing protein